MNRILSLQFYLVSSSSAAPWPGASPLQLRDHNYSNSDTKIFSKRMFEQFTEYLTRWQICQLPLSSEGSKLFSFAPLTLWPGALPLDPAGGSAPDPRYKPPTANPLASPLTTIMCMQTVAKPAALSIASHCCLPPSPQVDLDLFALVDEHLLVKSEDG